MSGFLEQGHAMDNDVELLEMGMVGKYHNKAPIIIADIRAQEFAFPDHPPAHPENAILAWWRKLPTEVMEIISNKVSYADICTLKLTNSEMQQLINDALFRGQFQRAYLISQEVSPEVYLSAIHVTHLDLKRAQGEERDQLREDAREKLEILWPLRYGLSRQDRKELGLLAKEYGLSTTWSIWDTCTDLRVGWYYFGDWKKKWMVAFVIGPSTLAASITTFFRFLTVYNHCRTVYFLPTAYIPYPYEGMNNVHSTAQFCLLNMAIFSPVITYIFDIWAFRIMLPQVIPRLNNQSVTSKTVQKGIAYATSLKERRTCSQAIKGGIAATVYAGSTTGLYFFFKFMLSGQFLETAYLA